MLPETLSDTTAVTGCGESALDLKIKSFERDVDLTHQIVHGDQSVIVQTEGGSIPSIARLLYLQEQSITQRWEEILLNIDTTANAPIAKKYTFSSALSWVITHNQDCVDFQETIRNSSGQLLYAEVKPLNANQIEVTFTEPEEGSIILVFFKNIST